MRFPVAGESAAQLPWLWPDAHSLSALGQPLSQETWPILRRDPAALLLVHRVHSAFSSDAEPPTISAARFLEPRVLDAVLRWFHHDRGHWLDFRQPTVLPIYRAAVSIAQHARIIAELTRSSDPDAAWIAGLLAPLGWFAIAASEPLAVADCLSDPAFSSEPSETQQRHWGLDQDSIVRRLARRWQLPEWLRCVLGHLDLPLPSAVAIGADPAFFATIQLAAGMADHAGYSLGLVSALEPQSLLEVLKLQVGDLRAVQDRVAEAEQAEAFDLDCEDPRDIRDLPWILQKAAEARRDAATPFLAPLEQDVDRLHSTLVHWKKNEEERLRVGKLAALAEFAAGASHEINNPLAVISGQGQYLLQQEFDDEFRPALESIVRQTRRIHSILTDLMQFARPPKMNRKPVALNEIIRSAVETFRGLANEAGTNLDCVPTPATLWVSADPRHLQTAIGCLVRNAIEAASLDKGWVRVRVESLHDRVDILVEDNGPGLLPAQREHLFDPFYSGRSAGRGRGLGLPTAWRLARENGGDVRHVPTPGGPTTFVMSLPRLESAEKPVERLSA